MKNFVTGQPESQYIIKHRPPPAKTRNGMMFMLSVGSLIIFPLAFPFVIIFWILAIFETSRENKRNGY